MVAKGVGGSADVEGSSLAPRRNSLSKVVLQASPQHRKQRHALAAKGFLSSWNLCSSSLAPRRNSLLKVVFLQAPPQHILHYTATIHIHIQLLYSIQLLGTYTATIHYTATIQLLYSSYYTATVQLLFLTQFERGMSLFLSAGFRNSQNTLRRAAISLRS